jgi:ABC-2 type transport system ATP-binding protein
MDEAEKLCDRVAVIDHGKVIAEGPPPELIATLGGDHVIELALTNGALSADEPAAGRQVLLLGESLRGMDGVSSVHVEGREMALAVSEPHVILPVLLRKVQDSGSELSRLSIRHASLEDVFVRLTGRHLRDGEAPRT